MAALEDRERALIVPVVNDVLEEVGVAAARDLLEEVAADGLASLGQLALRDSPLRPLRRGGQIEDHSAESGILVQDPDQERAVATPDG